MFKRILHHIFSFPLAYNLAQIIFGGSYQRKKVIQNQHLSLQNDCCVLDLGGGTGLYRDLWPKDCRYICLDNDLTKLNGVIKAGPSDFMLLADVKSIPIKDNSVDIIFCNSVSHHISDEILESLLSESTRVLKDSGKLLFLDAVLRQESFLNRFLWSLDRGEYPHTQGILTQAIERHFIIDHLEKFSHAYDFVFYVCSRKR